MIIEKNLFLLVAPLVFYVFPITAFVLEGETLPESKAVLALGLKANKARIDRDGKDIIISPANCTVWMKPATRYITKPIGVLTLNDRGRYITGNADPDCCLTALKLTATRKTMVSVTAQR